MRLPDRFCMTGAVLCGIIMPASALAQIIPDRTLGAESPQVIPDVTVRGERATRIEGGAVRGSNLFQSFQEFNVNEGQRVYFANPVGIQNILTRVTGSNTSDILGTLGVEGAANLFLLNPNGIVFGSNARLDINGSFVGSTGAIAFPDGSEFSATQPQAEPLLSVHVPMGLQYGTTPDSPIVSRGNLSVGQNLTLAAGSLQVQGQLQAGRDLTLQSPNPITGQTVRFSSGRDFRMGDYRGSALQVNAGRNINYGDVVIDAIDPTINPINPVVLLQASGQITGTGNLSTTVADGGLQVDFLSQGDMNIREITTQGGAIQLTSLNGGITTNRMALDTTNGARDGGSIELRGFDDITAGNLNSSSSSISEEGRDTEDTGNGGAITLISLGDIRTGDLDSSSSSISTSTSDSAGNAGNTRNGGAIALRTFGDIYTGFINSSSLSESSSFSSSINFKNSGNTGNGGTITFNTLGSIRTGDLNSYSRSSSHGNAGSSSNGGTIIANANGDIHVQFISSYSEAASKNSGDSNSGNGGAIIVNTNGDIYTENLLSYSRSFSSSNPGESTGNTGSGGIITLTTDSNIRTSNLDSRSYIFSHGNFGNTGDSGAITLIANGNIHTEAIDSRSISIRNFGNIGNGGMITLIAGGNIRTGRLLSYSISTNSGFSSFSNPGNGGAITLTANGNIDTDDLTSGSFSGENSDNGGAITVTANGNIRTGDLGTSSSSDKNSDDGGAITLIADGNIRTGNLTTYSFSNRSSGNGGAIALTANGNIYTQALESYSFSSSAPSLGGAGGEVTLSAISAIHVFSINSTGYLRGGDITITTGAPFSLDNRVTTDTSVITSDSNGFRSGVITSDTFGSGRGGNIQITAPSIIFLNGAQASASTHNAGQAGDVVLKAGSIVLDGNSSGNHPPGGLFQNENSGLARISPGSFLGGYIPSGNASNLRQQPRDAVYPSGIFTQTTTDSTGDAGNIRIEAEQLTIRDGAAIAVSTFGSGSGGDITIEANSLLLDRGTLTASTLSGSGGNLTIQNLDRLLMRHESLISAQARNSANGGNITIDAPDGVIVAIPAENNDIVASAQRGNGGRIDMTIASITGLQATAARTPLSDITASSDLGVDGDVQITPLTTDPSQGSLELPTEITDASTQISQNCAPTGQTGQFVISGRGGLPLSPDQPLQNRAVLSPEWVSLDSPANETAAGQRNHKVEALPPDAASVPAVVEANGWTVNIHGKVALINQPQSLHSVPQRDDRVCLEQSQ